MPSANSRQRFTYTNPTFQLANHEVDFKLNNYLNIIYINFLGSLNLNHAFDINKVLVTPDLTLNYNKFLKEFAITIENNVENMDTNILNTNYVSLEMLYLDTSYLMDGINKYFVSTFELLKIITSAKYDLTNHTITMKNVDMNTFQVLINMMNLIFFNALNNYQYSSNTQKLTANVDGDLSSSLLSVQNYYENMQNDISGFLGSVKKQDYAHTNLGYLVLNMETDYLKNNRNYSVEALNNSINFFQNINLFSQIFMINMENNFYQKYAYNCWKYFFQNYDINVVIYTNITDSVWENLNLNDNNYLFISYQSQLININGLAIFDIFENYSNFILNSQKLNLDQINIYQNKLEKISNIDINDFVKVYNSFFQEIKDLNINGLKILKDFLITKNVNLKVWNLYNQLVKDFEQNNTLISSDIVNYMNAEQNMEQNINSIMNQVQHKYLTNKYIIIISIELLSIVIILFSSIIFYKIKNKQSM